MEMSIILPAGDDTVFHKDAFEASIGQALIVDGQAAVINKAVVDENGKSVEFTITIDVIIWGDYKGDPADY